MEKKYLKYLFIPGIIIVVAGLVAAKIVSSWSPLYIGLLIIGSLILIVWLGVIFPDFWQKRATKAGTNAVIKIIVMLAIFSLINFLALRYSTRIDLTENQLFTLATQSQQIVQNLTQPLKVWVFTKEADEATRELLQNYRHYSPNFQFQFVSPQENIPLAEKFNVQLGGDVYVEYGDKQEFVQKLTPTENLSEIQLTNAIEKVQRIKQPLIYFLQGHGETLLEEKLTQAVASLEAKGLSVKPLNFVQEIPEDATVIVINSPQQELFPAEITALKTFLEQGGRLMVMTDVKSNPGVEPILKEWGVEISDRLIVDASETGAFLGFGPATALVTDYGNHPITQDFTNGISVYPFARPLNISPIQGIETIPLLITHEQTWAESNLTSESVTFDSGEDIKGPLELGVALQKTGEKTAKIIVIGNATFATDGWFEQQLNGDVFLNAISWLAFDDNLALSIRPKQPSDRRINLTPLQGKILKWLALVIIPLLGFLAAFITWWRQR